MKRRIGLYLPSDACEWLEQEHLERYAGLKKGERNHREASFSLIVSGLIADEKERRARYAKHAKKRVGND